ncbi:MAG: hypothetical protein BJ554DRAFT_791, partial [Olpidium bornovanus]
FPFPAAACSSSSSSSTSSTSSSSTSSSPSSSAAGALSSMPSNCALSRLISSWIASKGLFANLRILVDLRLVLDIFRPVRVPQCAQGLVVVVTRRAQRGDHERFRVAAERVLEQPSQLRVAVGNVRALPVNERRYDVPEGRQAEVNLRRLFQPLACCLRLGLTLGSGKVDEVQLPHSDVALAAVVGVRVAGLDGDREYAVAARAPRVHLGEPDAAVFVARCHQLLHLRDVLDDEGADVLDVHADVGALLDLELIVRPALYEEVSDFLGVDLQVRSPHKVPRRRGRRADVGKNVLERVWKDPPQFWNVPDAFHGERLSGSCLGKTKKQPQAGTGGEVSAACPRSAFKNGCPPPPPPPFPPGVRQTGLVFT